MKQSKKTAKPQQSKEFYDFAFLNQCITPATHPVVFDQLEKWNTILARIDEETKAIGRIFAQTDYKMIHCWAMDCINYLCEYADELTAEIPKDAIYFLTKIRHLHSDTFTKDPLTLGKAVLEWVYVDNAEETFEVLAKISEAFHGVISKKLYDTCEIGYYTKGAFIMYAIMQHLESIDDNNRAVVDCKDLIRKELAIYISTHEECLKNFFKVKFNDRMEINVFLINKAEKQALINAKHAA